LKFIRVKDTIIIISYFDLSAFFLLTNHPFFVNFHSKSTLPSINCKFLDLSKYMGFSHG